MEFIQFSILCGLRFLVVDSLSVSFLLSLPFVPHYKSTDFFPYLPLYAVSQPGYWSVVVVFVSPVFIF